jgi:AhpD family alkylhydroperoxidase
MTEARVPGHVERYEELRLGLRHLGAEVPAAMAGFGRLHRDGMADGALPRSTKELIALAIGICTPCDGCVTFHVHDALLAGATRAEVLEAIGVAVVMGGGPASIYAVHALEALDEFEAARDAATGGAS